MTDRSQPPVSETDIAVVGMAGRFPGARSVDEFWANLRDGVEARTTFTDDELRAAGVDPALLRDPDYVRSGFVLPEMEMFDAGFFGLSPKDAAIMDPQHRHFLECAWAALEHAGHVPSVFEGSIGVFAGCGTNAYLINNLLTNPDLVRSVGFFLLRHTGNDKDFLATRVSYEMDLRGPSVSVQTACSTSLVAIHMACQSLLNAECDMALAGGVTIKQPHRVGYLYKEGEILSPDGHCRAFDEASEGTVFGSGVGVVVLRRLSDAIADGDHVLAVVKGSAVNNDGSMKVGYLAPSVDGQAAAIAEALAVAGVSADGIDYVEAHGTGTPVGDPIEIAALTQAFRRGTSRRGFCAIGSLKTNVGHLDTAAGVASFIKVVQALSHRQMPPSLHFRTPNPAMAIDESPFFVNAALREWPADGRPRRAGVSSLGAGGTNAHVVLEEAPAVTGSAPGREWQVLVTSARTPAALDAAGSGLARHLRAHPEQSLADVAWTLARGRRHFRHRRAVVARTPEDAARELEARDAKAASAVPSPDAARTVAFMFAGGGAQYVGMGADLYRSEPVFRDEVDRCLAILRRHVDLDLSLLLAPRPGDEARAAELIERPAYALPALFTIQCAMAKLWMSWGIRPAAMIGHSMGEYTAAHLAGVLSLEDALALVALRGRLFERVPPGGMISVPLPADELRALMPDELSIAAENAPGLCVASGPLHAIAALERTLAEREIECRRIHIAIAAHSAMLDPLLGEFGEFFSRVTLGAPTIPFASNVSGTWITAAEATDPGYWVRHLRGTVRFADGVGLLLEDRERILLEVGPGRTLATLAGMHPAKSSSHAVVASMRHPDDATPDAAFAMRVLGQLWTAGASVDWATLFAGERRRRVPLPTYPFERVRHWVEPGAPAAAEPAVEDAARKRPEIADWCYLPSWRRTLSERPKAETSTSGPVLVLRDGRGLGAALAERLAGTRPVISVVAGGGFERQAPDRFTVDPRSAADVAAVVEALSGEGRLPSDIVHCWCLGDGDPGETQEPYARLRDRAFFSLLHLAQSLGREDLATPVALTVLSDGMQQLGGERAAEPLAALALGPLRVMSKEIPGVRARSVDVALPAPGSRAERRLLDRLVGELSSPVEDEIVALRGADRWVQTFEQVPLRPATEGWPLREGGIYLLTGGLGGIALEVAERLAPLRPTLVLVGRSGLPPRESWDRLASAGDDAVSRRIRAVRRIEAAGARVHVVTADVTDREQVSEVVRATRARWGALHGVLHLAGVLDDALIELKSDEAASRVLAPKVLGALALDAAIGEEPLDFFVLFSSRGAVTGPAGQVDYAAANAFLDAFAQARARDRDGLTLSIGWGTWQGIGMTAPAAGGRPTAHPLLERCIMEESDRTAYVTTFDADRQWVLDEHRTADGTALLPGTGYLELARAAFEERGTRGAVELSDVYFVAPFVVGPESRRSLRVTLTPNGGDGEFVIEGSIGAGAWQEHARGSVREAAPDGARTVRLAEVLERCAVRRQTFTGRESRLEHLRLGARWGNVRRIDYGHDEAVAHLELPAEFHEELAHFRLHPAMLDVATACAQSLIAGYDAHEDFYVPVSYAKLVQRAPIPPRCWSHIRYVPSEDGGKDTAVFDVTIVDEAGSAVVEITGFTMMRVAGGLALRDAERPADASGGRAAGQAANAPDLLPDEGILVDEGMEVLRRLLSLRESPAHVVVSPQDLPRWIERLRAPASPAAAAPAESADDPAISEVEAALASHEAVGSCAVVARDDRPGTRRLVAYLVHAPGQSATISEIRRYLRERLAEELVPQHYVELDTLPTRADGRLDRSALPDPFAAEDDHVAPRTPTEKLLAELWRELLGVGRVSVHDNFLDIGGHSLLAMRALARIAKKTGIRLGPSALNLQTLEQIASAIDGRLSPVERVESSPATVDAPPSKAPQGLVDRLFGAVRQTVSRT